MSVHFEMRCGCGWRMRTLAMATARGRCGWPWVLLAVRACEAYICIHRRDLTWSLDQAWIKMALDECGDALVRFWECSWKNLGITLRQSAEVFALEARTLQKRKGIVKRKRVLGSTFPLNRCGSAASGRIRSIPPDSRVSAA